MKKLFGAAVLIMLMGAGCLVYYPNDRVRPTPPPEDSYDNVRAPSGDLDIGYFYDYLNPYGLWISYAPYGYVWVPREVGFKWRPYTRGHWAWTDYGWTWVSLERWGWIAYHYGRWGWDNRMGWFWVPDVIWGPAWVAWRWGDVHIGWAPLPPGGNFVPGRGFGRHDWDIPGHYWSFVHGRDFMDRSLDRWVLPVERNVTIINRTVVNVNINVRGDKVHNDGVDLEQVRRMTNRTVERLSLKEASRADEDRVEGRDVVIYKPSVAPSQTARPKEVLEQGKAAERLDSERAGRVYRTVPKDESVTLRRAHEQEVKLMEESQDSEIREIRRKAEADKSALRNAEEKQKVDGEVQSRILELRKQHQEEKAKMTKRQKDEEEKTKRTPVRKKIEKTDKVDKIG